MARMIGNLDDLAATVERRARSEAKDKKQKARRRAEEMKDGAGEKAERVRQDILASARAEAEQKRRQRMAEARQAAMRKRLQAREDQLDRVWQRAEQRLRDRVGASDYADVLNQLTWLAVETLGPGRFILAADPRGHNLLTDERLRDWSAAASDAFDAEVTFERAREPADIWGGLIVREAERQRRLDATFSTRLELARDEIREDVFARLKGPHE